jgi:hypothetical protein
MNRLCAGALALGLLVACGDDDSASKEPTEGESAEDALERQLQFQADGQDQRAYAEIHPAQQELFTEDEYSDCRDRLGDIDLEEMHVKETFTEEINIEGTDTTVDSTAITVELVTSLGTATDTFHEVNVDGAWRFTVANPEEITHGVC